MGGLLDTIASQEYGMNCIILQNRSCASLEHILAGGSILDDPCETDISNIILFKTLACSNAVPSFHVFANRCKISANLLTRLAMISKTLSSSCRMVVGISAAGLWGPISLQSISLVIFSSTYSWLLYVLATFSSLFKLVPAQYLPSCRQYLVSAPKKARFRFKYTEANTYSDTAHCYICI